MKDEPKQEDTGQEQGKHLPVHLDPDQGKQWRFKPGQSGNPNGRDHYLAVEEEKDEGYGYDLQILRDRVSDLESLVAKQFEQINQLLQSAGQDVLEDH